MHPILPLRGDLWEYHPCYNGQWVKQGLAPLSHQLQQKWLQFQKYQEVFPAEPQGANDSGEGRYDLSRVL